VLASKRLLFLSFWCWVFLTLLGPIRNTDLWWHLASGRYIVTHHLIPSVDIFSLTCRGHVWLNVEWLYQVSVYSAYVLGGIFGITLFKIIWVSLIMAFIMRRLRQAGVSDLGIYACAIVVFAACLPGWSERADLISVTLVAALMVSLEGVRRGRLSRKHLLYWIPVFLIWANAHAGFIVGFGIAGLYAIEFIRLRRLSIRHAFLWLIAVGMTSFATPLGISMWKGIIYCLTLPQRDIQDIEEYWPPPWRHMATFWLALILFALLCARNFERRLKMPWLAWVISFLFGYEAACHSRYVPFFMVAAFPFVIESAFSERNGSIHPQWAKLFRTEWLTGGLLIMALMQWPRVALGVPPTQVPVDVCNYIIAHRIKGRFFTDYDFGSYWIWRFDGNPAVFIDGRGPAVDGYMELKNEIKQARRSPSDWQKFMRRYAITAVVTQDPGPTVRALLTTYYFPKNQWKLVYRDALALLFVKSAR